MQDNGSYSFIFFLLISFHHLPLHSINEQRKSKISAKRGWERPIIKKRELFQLWWEPLFQASCDISDCLFIYHKWRERSWPVAKENAKNINYWGKKIPVSVWPDWAKFCHLGDFFCLGRNFIQELIYYWAIFWAKFYLLWANFFRDLGKFFFKPSGHTARFWCPVLLIRFGDDSTKPDPVRVISFLFLSKLFQFRLELQVEGWRSWSRRTKTKWNHKSRFSSLLHFSVRWLLVSFHLYYVNAQQLWQKRWLKYNLFALRASSKTLL